MNKYASFTFTSGNYYIVHTRKEYGRTDSGKSWKKNPVATSEKLIENQNYQNFVTSIPFFQNFGFCRASYGYTAAGYIPVSITTVSPNGDKKLIDSFEFISKTAMTTKAGWREKNAMETATKTEVAHDGWHELLYFYDENGNELSVYDSATCKWVG